MGNTGGFARIPAHIFGTVTLNELGVLAAIHLHYPSAYPSHATLAREAGTSVTTLQRILVRLRKRGLIQIQSGAGAGTSNVYTLTQAYFESPTEVVATRLPLGQIDRPPQSDRPTPSVKLTDPPRSDRPTNQRTQPEKKPEKEPTSVGLTPDTGEEDVQVKQIGDGDMPEEGARVRPKKGPPEPGSSAWVVFRFKQMLAERRLRVGFNAKVLNAALADLRREGYTNETIEVMIQLFIAQEEQNIRRKTHLDPAVMFRHAANSLKAPTSALIDARKAQPEGPSLSARLLDRHMKDYNEQEARNG